MKTLIKAENDLLTPWIIQPNVFRYCSSHTQFTILMTVNDFYDHVTSTLLSKQAIDAELLRIKFICCDAKLWM